jgi:hypothetical protein
MVRSSEVENLLIYDLRSTIYEVRFYSEMLKVERWNIGKMEYWNVGKMQKKPLYPVTLSPSYLVTNSPCYHYQLTINN